MSPDARSGADRVWEPTRERVEVLSRLSELFTDEHLGPRQAMQRAAGVLAEALGDGIVVNRLSDDRRWMSAVAVHDPDPERRRILADAVGRRFPTDEGFTAAALEQERSLLIPRVTPIEILALQPAIAPVCEALGLRGFIVVPLSVRGRWIGLLWQLRTVDEPRLDEDDQRFLEEVAARFALVIENLRLSEALSERR
jgi:GAF domain-containing protein